MPGSKPLVVAVHGMGVFSRNKFRNEVTTAIDNVLKRYGYGETHKDIAVFREIRYDDVFEVHRKKIVANSKKMLSYLDGLGHLDGAARVARGLATFQQKIDRNGFINTHWLDVLLYMTNIGEQVRLQVAEQLTELILKHPNRELIIIAHSLGTAVIHDTFAKWYTGKGIPENTTLPKLSVSKHRVDKLWMMANVSRLLSSVAGTKDPYKSVVHPGARGCVAYFRNGRHTYDPFTWVKTFRPVKDMKWVGVDFESFEFQHVTQVNTHAIEGYIEAPEIAYRLLTDIWPEFDPSDKAWNKGNRKIKKLKDQKIAELRNKYSRLPEVNDVYGLLSMIDDFDRFKNELEIE